MRCSVAQSNYSNNGIRGLGCWRYLLLARRTWAKIKLDRYRIQVQTTFGLKNPRKWPASKQAAIAAICFHDERVFLLHPWESIIELLKLGLPVWYPNVALLPTRNNTVWKALPYCINLTPMNPTGNPDSVIGSVSHRSARLKYTSLLILCMFRTC